MSTEDILDAFGGKDAVASLTGAKPRAVEQWVRIGVPYRFWVVLESEAERRGIAGITLKTLANAKKAAVALLRRQKRAA
jgi:hypothetical protein